MYNALQTTEEEQNVDKTHSTCAAIGRYYKCLNQHYDQLFSKHCEENGFDEDDMLQELEEEPNDCQLLDFDEDFPFLEKPKSLKGQQKFIYNLIKKCITDPDITFDAVAPEFNEEFFEITQEDIDKTKEIYEKQCPVLWNQGMGNDRGFLQILAIGCKNDYDYLQYLVDDYLCDRIKHTQRAWNANDWNKNHKHFKKLKNINLIDDDNKNDGTKLQTPYTLACGAVSSFGKRFCPILQFSPLVLINDSLETTCKYIEAAFTFIRTLINEASAHKTKRAICPFQIDICIASGKPKKQDKMVTTNIKKENNDDNNGDNNDDNKDDDDDDDDDDYMKQQQEQNEQQEPENDEFVDCIGDIHEKLNKNGLKYKMDSIKTGDIIQQRVFIKLFNQMEVNSDNKNDDKFYNLHKKRLVAFVDRRTSKDVNDKDPVYLYPPPANCRDIPKDVVSEWHLSASRTCLLPNMEYGDGKEAESGPKQNNVGGDAEKLTKANIESDDGSDAVEEKKKDETAEKLKNGNIGSSSHCKGALLTLSFHCKSIDEIKCYLYWNGQITRFMPEHIKTVLPLLFNMEYEGNQAFIDDEAEVNGLIIRMNENFKDKFFKAFQQSCI